MTVDDVSEPQLRNRKQVDRDGLLKMSSVKYIKIYYYYWLPVVYFIFLILVWIVLLEGSIHQTTRTITQANTEKFEEHAF